MKALPSLLILTSLLLAPVAQAQAAAVTAFAAWKIAKREVNDEAKENLIEIRGVKSDHSLMPYIWEILFYDPYAEQDGRMVRIQGKNVVGIEQGYTQLDKLRLAAYKQEEVLDVKQLKLDSDKILDALKRSTALKEIEVSSLEILLRKADKGSTPPVWNVVIHAISDQTGKETKIGKAKLSAETGQIYELTIDTKKLK